MHSPTSGTAASPLRYGLPAHVSYVTNAAGIILSAGGNAWENVGKDPETVVGASIWHLLQAQPELLAPIRAALRERVPYMGVDSFKGRLWLRNIQPLVDGDKVIGASVLASEIQPEKPAAPANPVRITEAAGDYPEYGIESKDRFIRQAGQRGVLQVRLMSEVVYEMWAREDPTRVHRLRDDLPPPLRLI